MAEAERKTETIPQWKREEVDELVETIESFESVGIVGVTGIPSRQLQNMRAGLHGTAELRMSRNTLLRRALEQVDEGLEVLAEHVQGEVGLIGTDANPFTLYKELEASKTPAPISAGEVAPNDIVIPEGDTGIDPGPFVGDLQSVGAEARIMEGSIKVTADSTVLEAGEEVSADLEGVLAELEIEPKEVGLDLRAVYADGVLFEPDELAIDVDAYRADVSAGAARARNLAVNAGFPTAETLPITIRKATAEAKSLGLAAAIEDPELMDDLISKADAQLRTLAAAIDDEEALPEALRGVEAPDAPAAGGTAAVDAADADADESTDDQPDEADADDAAAGEDASDDADAGDDETGDDGEASGEGLGDLFG